ncbi:(5-formylfuran-3-yl)methyl phosphate synthase [Nitrosococcus oceani]|uniref:(5-formylfuran-3-yl)methyl phosphate synthase n=2 Tax=Nitrosococcus oceani TaxID=1229 RepID=Q3JF34_NITOC|nr:(5-formylfuran-3-yl)methyl phosphate synthase [Nitrosococcus oceani]KFI20988.1 hypothetical protein IB75_00025 [Nitrosococcus oceani C-27]ABA56562.1 Protein of unknown function DUF556 [Nitrosococcus oceani ATCC 19707]EDZ66228.1 conserved hypothetical protein [Nitrosococcus oceani AFC27]KFI24078.1 hypothetical protein HW44_00115 [Nitrosococcus oceani]GEM21606.1 hypothetical protein NONS58_30520 [Nitrosococcus oceani]
MNRWLASARNLEEASYLLAEGPDIIDFKEPKRGVLGALPPETVRQAVALIGGRCQTSATIGDFFVESSQISQGVLEIAATGVDYVKIALFSNTQQAADCLISLQPLAARGVSMIGVIFADKQPDFSWIHLIKQAGFKGIMLDTAVKDGRGLLSHLSLPELDNFIKVARNANLVSGLAGSLSIQDIPKLLSLKANYLGFRSALCTAGNRCYRLDPKAVLSIKRAIRENPRIVEN